MKGIGAEGEYGGGELGYLPRIPVVGDDGCDGSRRSASQAADEQEELHDVVVDGPDAVAARRRGLQHVDVRVPHRRDDLDVALAIIEARALERS